jgi:hypothetical protein
MAQLQCRLKFMFGEPNATFAGADSYHFVEASSYIKSGTWLVLQEEYPRITYFVSWLQRRLDQPTSVSEMLMPTHSQ